MLIIIKCWRCFTVACFPWNTSQLTLYLLGISASILFSPVTVSLHFLPHCSANMVPLCQLLKKDAAWTQAPRLQRGTTVHQAAAHQTPLLACTGPLEPGWAHCASLLYFASSVLEWNSHPPPLEASEKLRGWEEAFRWPVGIGTHLSQW